MRFLHLARRRLFLGLLIVGVGLLGSGAIGLPVAAGSAGVRALPRSVGPATGVHLTPATATDPIGTAATITAVVTDVNGNPVPGSLVTFFFLAGSKNFGVVGSVNPVTTDSLGHALWTYQDSNGGGSDTIEASIPNPKVGAPQINSTSVVQNWETIPTSKVCVVKFQDTNGNGVQGTGEPLLANWQFTVKDGNGHLLGQLTSGGKRDCLSSVAPGIYTVSEIPQTGWTATTGSPPGTLTQSVGAGATVMFTFGNERLGRLCVVKFEDTNGNGIRNQKGEPFLSGWQFAVAVASSGADRGVASSGADRGTLTSGRKRCEELAPGSYAVTEVPQTGWIATAPASGQQTAHVVSGQTTTVTFGNRCCSTHAFLNGKPDNFSHSDGSTAEPTNPVPGTPQSHFDQNYSDTPFSDRLTLTVPSGYCINSAILEISMRPLYNGPANDTVSLKIGPASWSKSIQSISLNTAPSSFWDDYGPAKLFTWNLAALPLGSQNILAALNSIRHLDIRVQDDTMVDYARLTVKYCTCSARAVIVKK